MMQWQLDGKTCKYYGSGTPDGATDGDLDIGYGLILADKQWGGYTADAKNWLADVLRADVASDGHLKCEDDADDPADTRPSDGMIDHLRAFAAYDTAHDWNKVIAKPGGAVELTSKYSRRAPACCRTSWSAPTPPARSPRPANYQENQPDNIVGYNSIRVPWHLGTDALVYGAAPNSPSTAKAESDCLKKFAKRRRRPRCGRT